MKLSDRGVNYQYAPATLEVTEDEIYSQNRGQNSSFGYVRHIPVPPPAPNLMYRGVAYRSEQPPVAKPVAKINDRTWLTRKNSEEVLDEATTTHLANIRRSLEHRLNVAKANGDRTLLRQLEAESQQIAFQA